jgi:hypothetical protein
MSRSTIFTLLCAVGCLALALPAAAQPLALTLNNGCDVYVMVDGKLRLHEFGHVGNLTMQKVRTGQAVNLALECVDFPMEPEVTLNGIQQSRSICNWRLDGGGRGTNRAEVRWFPGSGGQLSFTVNAEVIRGNRYTSGVTSAQGEVDQSTGTIALDSFVAVYCRRLSAPRP